MCDLIFFCIRKVLKAVMNRNNNSNHKTYNGRQVHGNT